MPRISSYSFKQAQQEKRELFQSRWNRFIQNRAFYGLIILLLAGQILFLLSSVGFIREQAIFLTVIKENPPLWCEAVIYGIAILLSLPGFGIAAGLWKICRKTRWQEDTSPDISGVKLIKLTNILLCVFTGLILALYPTIIITAGEYLMEFRLFRLFYLLMPFVAMFAMCVSLVRIAIRKAEENIVCCWSDTGCLLPLILILAAIAAAVLLFFDLTLFSVSIAALAAVYAAILMCWWIFLKKTLIRQAAIEHKAIASQSNPDDPYSRY